MRPLQKYIQASLIKSDCFIVIATIIVLECRISRTYQTTHGAVKKGFFCRRRGERLNRVRQQLFKKKRGHAVKTSGAGEAETGLVRQGLNQTQHVGSLSEEHYSY